MNWFLKIYKQNSEEIIKKKLPKIIKIALFLSCWKVKMLSLFETRFIYGVCVFHSRVGGQLSAWQRQALAPTVMLMGTSNITQSELLFRTPSTRSADQMILRLAVYTYTLQSLSHCISKKPDFLHCFRPIAAYMIFCGVVLLLVIGDAIHWLWQFITRLWFHIDLMSPTTSSTLRVNRYYQYATVVTASAQIACFGTLAVNNAAITHIWVLFIHICTSRPTGPYEVQNYFEKSMGRRQNVYSSLQVCIHALICVTF